jgi:hypothetical protein
MFKTCLFSGESFDNVDVMQALERANNTGTRIRIWYGDTNTGLAWAEENDVVGYVGRSTGKIKAPLLIQNKRSADAGIIVHSCIVRIDTTQGRTLYKHRNFNAGNWWADTQGQLWHFGEVWGMFESELHAIRRMNFMLGKRYSK